MANIFDYLKWRSDIPFSVDPFNEVDNLVLSELIYASFDGILGNSLRGLSLKTADRKYFDVHSRDEAEKSNNHIVKAPLLMDGMLSGERFGTAKLIKYVDLIDADRDMQIAAVTYLLSDGTAYIAFRGTDSTVVGWKEDLNMSFLPVTEGQRRAVRYLNEVGAKIDRPLRIGGHSKGGNFAVYAAAFCNKSIQRRILNVYTNDGPGFRDEIKESAEYKSILPKVISIVPDTSIIGMLLTSDVEHLVIKSNEKGIMQHDALTWQVERNRFLCAEQSQLGQFIERSQQDWLSKIDDESREYFVNTLFSVFESTGMDTFGEMKIKKLKAAERIFSSIKGMPTERQKDMLGILDELLQSGTHIARDTLADKRN